MNNNTLAIAIPSKNELEDLQALLSRYRNESIPNIDSTSQTDLDSLFVNSQQLMEIIIAHTAEFHRLLDNNTLKQNAYPRQ